MQRSDFVPPWARLVLIFAIRLSLCNGLLLQTSSATHDGVYGVQTLVDEVKDAATAFAKKRENIDRRIEDEKQRLTAVAQEVVNSSSSSTATKDLEVLLETIKMNEEARVESMAAEKAMSSFYYSLRGALGSQAPAPSCSLLRCSDNAKCIQSAGEARCRCNQCFEGDGFQCRASKCTVDLYMHPLPILTSLSVSSSEAQYAADIFLAVYGKDRLGVVFRDPSLNDEGFLMTGIVGEEAVQWNAPQAFSNATSAFEPALAILPTGRLVIAYRDTATNAIGYLVGGYAAVKGNATANLTSPQAYGMQQSGKAALVPLANSQVACLFAEPEVDLAGVKRNPYGAAALLKVTADGTLYLHGTYHFAQATVSQIAAVSVSPSSFVVAFKGLPNAGQQAATSSELSAVWMDVRDNELVQHPNPLTLEPSRRGMESRDLALLSQNLIAYSYQSSGDEKTKVAIIRLNPATHQMTTQGQTQVISTGEAEGVQGVSLPYGGQVPSPYSLTYLRHEEEGAVAQVCKVSFWQGLSDCHKFRWANDTASSGSAARLGDGRLVFAYTTNLSVPFLQFVDAPSTMGR